MELKSITKDDTKGPNAKKDDKKDDDANKQNINIYKNYIPLCLVVTGVAGLGLYIYQRSECYNKHDKEVVVKQDVQQPPVVKKEIDPFELR